MIDMTTTPVVAALLGGVSLTLLLALMLSFFQSVWAQTFNTVLTLLALTTATVMVVSETTTQILAIFYVTLFMSLINIANIVRAVVNIKRSGAAAGKVGTIYREPSAAYNEVS
jgi:hypothetical protein